MKQLNINYLRIGRWRISKFPKKKTNIDKPSKEAYKVGDLKQNK